MKHIYKLSIVMLAVFTFVGCAVDNDDPVVVNTIRDLTATLADQRAIIAVPDNTTSYDLVINFSEALPSYSTIEYTIDGVTTTTSRNTGDTSLTIPITFGLGENFHDVNLTDFIVVNATQREVLPIIGGVTSTTVIKEGFFTATMNWDDAVFDLDLGLQPMTATWVDTFAWIDTSVGTTNQEFVEGAELADGNYALFIQHFTAPADVNVTFTLVSAGGNFTFNVLTTGDGNVLWFTKSTDGSGNVSYQFFEQDPA